MEKGNKKIQFKFRSIDGCFYLLENTLYKFGSFKKPVIAAVKSFCNMSPEKKETSEIILSEKQ